jgi:DNA-binding XRE family transcriptional regulator
MAKITEAGFGQAVRQRRRLLDMTQMEVARRIGTSTPYIGHLESGVRHPSEKIVIKIAEVLGLDPRELFLLANPGTKILLSEPPAAKGKSAWERFVKNRQVRKIHNITDREMETLSRVAMMGEVRCVRDFLFILNSIRQALGQ